MSPNYRSARFLEVGGRPADPPDEGQDTFPRKHPVSRTGGLGFRLPKFHRIGGRKYTAVASHIRSGTKNRA